MAILRITRKINLKTFLVRHKCNQPNFGFIFDIDGVIVRGQNVLPCALEGFKRLIGPDNKFRIPTVFVTNNGDSLQSEKAADLSRLLGIDIDENQVILSYSPLSMLKDYKNKRILFSGQGDNQKIASNLGFKNVLTMDELVRNFPSLNYVNKHKRNPFNGPRDKDFKKVDGIILLNEPINWEISLQLMVDLLISNGLPSKMYSVTPYPHIFVIACNLDLLWVSEAPIPRYGHGAFLHCLESLFRKLTNKELIYTATMGKPSEITYCFANKRIIEHAKTIGINHNIDKIYAIGDNINTDIYGANLYNQFLKKSNINNHTNSLLLKLVEQNNLNQFSAKSCISILVQTGVHNKDTNFLAYHSHRDFMPLQKNLCNPSIIAEDVGRAIDIVLKQEIFE